MVRRFLCLGVALLALLLSVPACGEGKTKNKGPTVPDPEGAAKPMVPRGG
jgi:hypothetical protein